MSGLVTFEVLLKICQRQRPDEKMTTSPVERKKLDTRSKKKISRFIHEVEDFGVLLGYYEVFKQSFSFYPPYIFLFVCWSCKGNNDRKSRDMDTFKINFVLRVYGYFRDENVFLGQ